MIVGAIVSFLILKKANASTTNYRYSEWDDEWNHSKGNSDIVTPSGQGGKVGERGRDRPLKIPPEPIHVQSKHFTMKYTDF